MLGGKGTACRVNFRFLFAASQPATKFFPAPGHHGVKRLGMIGSAFLENLIRRRLWTDGLQMFLKLTLGIFLHRTGSETFDLLHEKAAHHAPGSVHAAIQKNSAGNSFQCIGQGGITLTTAAAFFTARHEEEAAETDLFGNDSERLGGNKLGAHFGQHAFISLGELKIKYLRENKLKDRIAKKLQPLIIRLSALHLITKTGMGQCLLEQ